MILKELRLSKHLSQEQLADMSGLNVRTIQRIESGDNASLESKKCLASALDISIETLEQEQFMIDKKSESWNQLPPLLKLWFIFNFLQRRPTRKSAQQMIIIGHSCGFIFCCFGFNSEPALAGGLLMLATGYLFNLLKWQGDKYGIWFDVLPPNPK
ncbi:MAG: helix-turn-helix domain-containing protein [Gammaproteobacteria bacterium]|nr:helix-turn-helix domain-containing protein [Gammaproteobacteria bacterium]NNJ72277.1 helix-turn-helix transcriptional regulator [Enterobacterales bacterium]